MKRAVNAVLFLSQFGGGLDAHIPPQTSHSRKVKPPRKPLTNYSKKRANSFITSKPRSSSLNSPNAARSRTQSFASNTPRKKRQTRPTKPNSLQTTVKEDPVQLVKLENILSLALHLREVAEDFQKKKVRDTQDFEWVRNPR